jgi:hypothetical protein
MLEKYGVEHALQKDEFQKKCKNTKKAKYNDENFNNREKAKQTCLERYGVDNSFKCEAVKYKWQQTMLSKYGSTHPYFGHSFYEYDNRIFDSSWELIFYCWLQLEGKIFSYHSLRIPYIINGNKHYYESDFEVDGTLIEIKGPQFFNNEGHLINPWTGEVLLEKEQCMANNSVVIISDIRNYKKEVLSNFGKDFIKNCTSLKEACNDQFC